MFRTSPWDPKENLPLDYARIFKFANFNRTKKMVFANIHEDETRDGEVALPGAYITIHISNVPTHFYGMLYKFWRILISEILL